VQYFGLSDIHICVMSSNAISESSVAQKYENSDQQILTM